MQYYIKAYKTGSYPAIAKDRVFLWARLYPVTATASDSVGKPANYPWVRSTAIAVAQSGYYTSTHLLPSLDPGLPLGCHTPHRTRQRHSHMRFLDAKDARTGRPVEAEAKAVHELRGQRDGGERC